MSLSKKDRHSNVIGYIDLNFFLKVDLSRFYLWNILKYAIKYRLPFQNWKLSSSKIINLITILVVKTSLHFLFPNYKWLTKTDCTECIFLSQHYSRKRAALNYKRGLCVDYDIWKRITISKWDQILRCIAYSLLY